MVDDLKLIENASDVGGYLNAQMKAALGDHPKVGDIRGEGMLCAVELVEDRDGRTQFDPARKVVPTIVGDMLKAGVIARAMPQGDIIGFAPPFCLTEDEADRVVASSKEAVASVLG